MRAPALLTAYLAALLAAIAMTPARADDISAAGRGVVRIVTVAVAEDEVVGFGHGSGFAVGPNRIVTNAHVVELAARYPGNVAIGIVPSEGQRSFGGRLVAVDPARDLALIEVSDVRLPPLSLYTAAPAEGEAVFALGYPGNVDLATARSADDYITPLRPVRSAGSFAGGRTLGGTGILLHTAAIARGNSGGPLLDRCGRVIGVNSALTRGDEGDASFALAVTEAELVAFLREAGQAATLVATPCTTMEERIAADGRDDERARTARDAAARAAADRGEAEREAALDAAREVATRTRENVMGLAVLLLVGGAMGVGAGTLLAMRGHARARVTIGAGAATMLLAVVVFVLRPGTAAPASDARPPDAARPATPPQGASSSGSGPLACRPDAGRSRVTVSQPADLRLEFAAGGCVNGRTQYAEDGRGGWTRTLVPDDEATVSVLSYDPATRTYADTRYYLDAARMAEARRLRAGVSVKACTTDAAARASLAAQQSAIRAALPPLPNEKLVYACRPAR